MGLTSDPMLLLFPRSVREVSERLGIGKRSRCLVGLASEPRLLLFTTFTSIRGAMTHCRAQQVEDIVLMASKLGAGEIEWGLRDAG